MSFDYIRTFRTPHSERFLVSSEGKDKAVFDVHYLQDSSVEATLIIFDGSGLTESDAHRLVSHIDEVLLPSASLDDHRLRFNVVIGRVLGVMEPDSQEDS
jgi:hypothetical protein